MIQCLQARKNEDLFSTSLSSSAHWFSLALLGVILFSVIALVAESVPSYMPPVDKMGKALPQGSGLILTQNDWKQIDIFCTVIFTMEFGTRLWVLDINI